MTAERLARAEVALADLSDVSGTSATVGGISCAAYDIDQPWATWARPVSPPDAVDFRLALDWLAAHGGQWSIKVSARDVTAPVFHGLAEWAVLPAFVLTDPTAAERTPAVPGLTVATAREPAEFLATYGEELAPLVTERHLASPGYRYLVGWMDDEPVACAQLRRGADTVYLSAVTVRSSYRRRGIGAAISAAATRQARQLGAETVWLHAAGEDSARIYRRLGYQWADDHVLLVPRP